MHQHVAEVVHIGETIDVTVSVYAVKSTSQFLQRVWAEGAEHQQAIRFQHAVQFAESGGQVVTPLQGKIRPHHSHAIADQRQRFDIGADMALLTPGEQLAPPA